MLEGFVPYPESFVKRYQEKGYWIPPLLPEPQDSREKPRTTMGDFYEEPEKYPLKTPSGKIEFYSQNLAKHFPDDKERPPLPH